MTSTDRLAEMAAEISRLHTKIVGLEAIVADNEARVANTHGMAAEIERLKHQNMLLQADNYTLRKEQHLDHLRDRLRIMEENQAAAAREADRHISRLQARIAELEALATVGHGTMGTLQQPTPDEPATITHDIPPNAPR